MKKTIIFITLILAAATASATAQVAANPPYTLDQSVIAGGGGQNSTGGSFTLDGAIGQAIAGTTSTNAPFSVQSGFFIANAVAPTAASVVISGKVLTDGGRGLRNARVLLTNSSGEIRIAMTTAFGYYRFAEVVAGQTYIISIESKRYQFAPQVISATEDINNLDFSATGTTAIFSKKPF